jgi:hypothetical protein
VERMKGSVIDAMSSAIEGAEVMLFGVCESYKESANCVRTCAPVLCLTRRVNSYVLDLT